MPWRNAPIIEPKKHPGKSWMDAPLVELPAEPNQAEAPHESRYARAINHPVGGLVEAAMSLGSGMAGQVAGGLAGIAGTLLPGDQGQGARWTEGVSNAMTYQPRSEAGQRTIEGIAEPLQFIGEGLDAFGGVVTDATGSPESGVAARVIPEAAMMAFGGLFRPRASAPTAARTAQPGTAPHTLQAAREAGYTIPPSQLVDGQHAGGIGRRLSETAGGKIRTEQAATRRNQEVTDRLAAKAIGLQRGETLSQASIARARAEANRSYDDIPNAVPQLQLDATYTSDLSRLSGTANSSFPGRVGQSVTDLIDRMTKNPTPSTQDAITLIRELRENARRHGRGTDVQTVEIARAERAAADALEGLIGRNLQAAGQPQLLSAYQAARERLAKIHTVENAMNPGTSHINPQAILRDLRSGRPLTGELRTIAETAAAFPKAMQPFERLGGHAFGSPLDMFAMSVIGGGGALATGGITGGLAGLSWPAVRQAGVKHALSPPAPPPRPGFTGAGGRSAAVSALEGQTEQAMMQALMGAQ